MKALIAAVLLTVSTAAMANGTVVIHEGGYSNNAHSFSVAVRDTAHCAAVIKYYQDNAHSSFSAECWDDEGNLVSETH